MYRHLKKLLSPCEFLALSDKERHRLKSSQIVPPKLGTDSFGSIEVTYKTPNYMQYIQDKQ